jgi:hypothetical protein
MVSRRSAFSGAEGNNRYFSQPEGASTNASESESSKISRFMFSQEHDESIPALCSATQNSFIDINTTTLNTISFFSVTKKIIQKIFYRIWIELQNFLLCSLTDKLIHVSFPLSIC